MNWKRTVGFRARGTRDEIMAQRLEKKIGFSIPAAYRNFLLETGGGYVDDALAECDEPTPFGKLNLVEFSDIDGVVKLLGNRFAPRHFLIIGMGHMGIFTGLSVGGDDYGHLYAVDSEMRHSWPPERYKHLGSPTVQDYYKLKNAGELRLKTAGDENCYHVADSFESLLEKLQV